MNLKVSGFEVTNDDVCDLLPSDGRRKSLLGKADIDVDPANEIICTSAQEVLSYYQSSLDMKKLKEQKGFSSLGASYSAHSSSHTFFKVILEQRLGNVGKKSTVTFVDLAPSDKILG